MPLFNPSQPRVPLSPSLTPPPVGSGTESKGKSRKLVGFDEDRLTVQAKATDTNSAKQGMDSLLPMAGQVSSTSRGAGLHPVQWGLGKTQIPSFQTSLPPSPPGLYPEHHVPRAGMCPWSVWIPRPGCASSGPAQTRQKHLCVISPMLSTNPNQPQINSIPANSFYPSPNQHIREGLNWMSGIQAEAISAFDALPEGAVYHLLPEFVPAQNVSIVSSFSMQGWCSAWKHGHKYGW